MKSVAKESPRIRQHWVQGFQNHMEVYWRKAYRSYQEPASTRILPKELEDSKESSDIKGRETRLLETKGIQGNFTDELYIKGHRDGSNI